MKFIFNRDVNECLIKVRYYKNDNLCKEIIRFLVYENCVKHLKYQNNSK